MLTPLPWHRTRQRLRFPTLAAVLALACLAWVLPAAAEEAAPAEVLKNLKYRSIGPAAGGRICRVAGVPGDPLVYYAATASGGIWKSSDGGLTWKPIFDDQPDSSIGSIAVAPSNPNLVYAGAGEANIRGNVVPGHGIYKSTDAGKTWTHVWKQRGQIGTMIVHPTNPDIAFAAVLGSAFGPNRERGVYRTTDGGKTWQQVLAKDQDTGASDVCFDPSNPQILFAGLWQTRRKPWELTSGGPGSGLYVSRDGGDTWKQLTPSPQPLSPRGRGAGGEGLPAGPWGKVGVGVAPSDGRRVYALIEAEKGGLFRSDDSGETWRLTSASRTLRQRAWYYTTLTIDPKNPDVVWCPQVPLLKSIDGGRTFRTVSGPHHGDHHDLWIDPQNPQRMINGNDGGVDITTNGGETWVASLLPISQFYHIAVDNRTPYHVSGAMQDLGTASGPSNSLSAGGIAASEWHSVGGGEAGFTAPDPSDPNIVYAGEYGGYISRYDHRTRQAQNVSIYPITAVGRGGEELRYRFQWTAPILISPHDPKTVYHGSNVLFRTSDGGKTWAPISQDLTRNDKSKQKWSGGPITGDNTGAEIYCTIFALAESPKQKGILWAGSDDGLVHVSRDGGQGWTNVTANVPGLPEWGTVSCLEASPHDAGTAYLVVDAHRLDDMRPYLWKTSDYGQTWASLSAKLPPDVYLHAVREDPKRKGLLYAGTERGVAYSADDGATWQQLKLNLPTVPVHDLVVKNDDLVVGTHGRSIWILDDLTPLRTLSPEVLAQDVHLFPAQDAVRYRYGRSRSARGVGDNPPRGAVVHYYLKKKPQGVLTLDVLDSQGAVVATLSSKADADAPADDAPAARFQSPRTVLPTEPGLQRVVWDLSHAGPTTIRGASAWPPPPSIGPTALPGAYTLRLTADSKTLTTPLTLRPDPRMQASEAELKEQLQLALTVRDQITHVARLVTQLRSLRTQLDSRKELWKDNPSAQDLSKLAQETIAKLDALEAKLHNPKAEIPYDLLAHRGGARLYSQLGALFGAVAGSDAAPTQGMREVHTEHTRELQLLEGEFSRLVGEDLAKLNEMGKILDVLKVVVPAATDGAKKP
jgi:photosystem II stability/assembly factor-like uncharacterized protein